MWRCPWSKDFIEKVRPRAIGENVIRSVTPGQQVDQDRP